MTGKYTDCRQNPGMALEDPHLMAKRNFMLQQGIKESGQEMCPADFEALVFQPRVVALILLAGLITQSWIIFLALGAVLWWSALLPALNPFDAIYNSTIGSKTGNVKLKAAPSPRRFAQALAGSFSTAVAIFLLAGMPMVAFIIEALFTAAAAALSFGRFCLGSFLYHVLRGKKDFALRTLPWSHNR